MPSLPARVRVSRLPLPPTANVAAQLRRLLPGVGLDTVTQAAAALAGGRVVGVAVLRGERTELGVEAGWRGKGLEEALIEALGQGTSVGKVAGEVLAGDSPTEEAAHATARPETGHQ